MSPVKKNITKIDREGVNYVRSIVEGANCIFHEIHNENDYGLDAIIELVVNNVVTGISFAAQIKSGKSYCYKSFCVLPADEKHIQYWLAHSLQVIGIVYSPEEKYAYWQAIESLLEDADSKKSGSYRLRIKKEDLRRLDPDTFREILMPIFLKKPILLPYDKSIDWARSDDSNKSFIGIKSLFIQFKNDLTAWDEIWSLLFSRPVEKLSGYYIYVLSLVPGHPDIFVTPENTISQDTKVELLKRINVLSQREVIKLLQFVDENGIRRGAIGQGVEAIIRQVKFKEKILEEIILDQTLEEYVREIALYLLAYYQQKCIYPLLPVFARDSYLKPLVQLLIEGFKWNDGITLY